MEISRFLAELHPRLVPFPIVLLLTALLLDGAGLIGRGERVHRLAKWLMAAGTVTLLLAFICGICAEIWAGRAGVPHLPMEIHELGATIASWGFIALMSWRLFLDPAKAGQVAPRRGAMLIYVVCGLALYTVIGVTGYLGGKLVTEYGASVAGADAKTVLTVHDLNTLAERQTDRNLEYSDFMHRTAGAFVLLLALSIFVRELWPNYEPKVRWVGPTLLKAGGVLLFLCADLDLYALTDVRQFYDREAQMHKLLAMVMVAVGLGMLLKQRRRYVAQKTEAQTRLQNRLIAVLALIGGGLLFTHVHTVAPYADVAAGVYVNHIVMGFVALAIGAVKLLDDALPNKARWRALLFPSLMGVEAFLLLTYTESIPWWAGIGHYNRWGPNGGCIAPLGKERAELVFDRNSAAMDVRVLDRFADDPVRIAATNVTVIVDRGYDETAVPLDAVDAERGTASHFRGRALFLKGVPQFDARVRLPLRGRQRTGYFDPWVTPGVAGLPPNVLAKYVCPMHEGMLSTTPGVCKLCGMPLVPVQLVPPQALHEAKYTIKLDRTGDTLRLTPEFTATGETVRDLLVMHEHLLHLIVVSEDLSFFDHVHPVRQDDGSFTIDYKFPHDGRFLLFADIMPCGERNQVFRLPVEVEANVGGASAPRSNGVAAPRPLPLSPAAAREIGQYHVEMIVQPRTLVAQREAQLAFRLERDGRPVTDLSPYIGAMGHCVIISEDTQSYLHSHPEQFSAAPPPNARGGPEVSFHTMFPRPGRYKVWGQFKRGNKIIVADFVVNVEKPILPRWLVNILLYD
ncbi:MAG TPA: DUF2231 domain-containing protein [Verrucomicrobiae bacterium]|nr:DUF2231 domain-containing protein [Verrucomicrobiae bacterium]